MAKRATNQVLAPAFRPLFAQIKELIVERVRAGEWQAGTALPSEHEFAAHYNVSQGTVRKAIAEMAAENLVERYRGKGTFVASHTDEREHSHFFHIVSNDGIKHLPGTEPLSCRHRKAGKKAAKRLSLKPGSDIVSIERLRVIDGKTVIHETIVVAERLFPGIADLWAQENPNEFYPLYEARYGVRVTDAKEKITAIAATETDANYFGIEAGAPLLEIDRIACTFGEKPVEWRRSRCHTANFHYLSELS